MSRTSPAIQRFVARELRALGLPEQRCNIQAAYLTYSDRTLAVVVTLPLELRRQGNPTGVIQIGTPKRTWNPELRLLIPEASAMPWHRQLQEVKRHLRNALAGAWRECERRGVQWPPSWPRLNPDGEPAVMRGVRGGSYEQHGSLLVPTKR